MTDLSQRSNNPPESVGRALPDPTATEPTRTGLAGATRCEEPDHSHLEGSGESRQVGTLAGRASLFTLGTGLALVAAHAVSIPVPPCPLRWTTGFPCPFCGFTHVAQALLTGQVAVVARHDPAGLVFAALVGVAVVAQLVAMAKRTEGPDFLTTRLAAIVLVAVLGAHWVTTIVTGGMLST